MLKPKTYAGFETPSSILADQTLGPADKRDALMGWRRELRSAHMKGFLKTHSREEMVREIDRTLHRLKASASELRRLPVATLSPRNTAGKPV